MCERVHVWACVWVGLGGGGSFDAGVCVTSFDGPPICVCVFAGVRARDVCVCVRVRVHKYKDTQKRHKYKDTQKSSVLIHSLGLTGNS